MLITVDLILLHSIYIKILSNKVYYSIWKFTVFYYWNSFNTIFKNSNKKSESCCNYSKVFCPCCGEHQEEDITIDYDYRSGYSSVHIAVIAPNVPYQWISLVTSPVSLYKIVKRPQMCMNWLMATQCCFMLHVVQLTSGLFTTHLGNCSCLSFISCFRG